MLGQQWTCLSDSSVAVEGLLAPTGSYQAADRHNEKNTSKCKQTIGDGSSCYRWCFGGQVQQVCHFNWKPIITSLCYALWHSGRPTILTQADIEEAIRSTSGGTVAKVLASHHGDLGSIPGGFIPRFSCRTMPLAGRFSRGTPASPFLAFQHRSILGSHFMSCPGHLRVPVGIPVTRRVLPRPGFTSYSSCSCDCVPERKLSTEVLLVDVERGILGDVRREDAAVAAVDAVAPLRLPVRQLRVAVERVDDAVLGDIISACEHRQAVLRGAVFLKQHQQHSQLQFRRRRHRLVRDFIFGAGGSPILIISPMSHYEVLHRPSSIPGRVTPGFSQVGIVLDDTADRRVFSGISRFPRPRIPVLLHSRFISPSWALTTSFYAWSGSVAVTHLCPPLPQTDTLPDLSLPLHPPGASKE
ncbi:hypothetical protein PR048_012052 [Dryococelus australis]|uniref:Uncharacterized protein n=1 Tax=Dryococelus australis TaxID=614101 RepID=A0ABQ9HP20_9NEOP|nr:hypothetical protein PR048_012052 [Dryococelus australis]